MYLPALVRDSCLKLPEIWHCAAEQAAYGLPQDVSK